MATLLQHNSDTPLIDDQEDNAPQSTDYAFKVEAGFIAVGEQILQVMGGSMDSWMRLSVEDKLLQFTSYLSNMRKDLRLGGLVGVYILIKNNSEQIGE